MVGDAATQFSLSCPVPACRLVQDVGHRLDRGQIVTLLAAVALSPILGGAGWFDQKQVGFDGRAWAALLPFWLLKDFIGMHGDRPHGQVDDQPALQHQEKIFSVRMIMSNKTHPIS